jgi:hypothetical protein
MKYINIEITRLPDITSYKHLDAEFDDYGRFGITNAGAFYVQPIQSSHLPNTKDGGYWAVKRDTKTLFLSPRGCTMGFEEFVKDIIDNLLIKKIYRKAGLI